MASYYFDTSALVKRYQFEPGTDRVDRILDDSGSEVLIARLTIAEMVSVLARKVRTGELDPSALDLLRLRFFADVAARRLRPVRVLNPHFDDAAELILRHGKDRQIRALDSLQLSVALRLPTGLTMDHFVCADRKLCEVAALEGVSVVNPED